MEILNKIQKELKAPKGQNNTFGGYRYRSCEDILEAVKPLLGEAILTINDEVVMLGDRFYVKATASITDGKQTVFVSAYAREPLEKKGMDSAQITGATSSYARKYALNGLFCIDDTKDADATNKHDDAPVKRTMEKKFTPEEAKQNATLAIEEANDIESLDAVSTNVKKSKNLTIEVKAELQAIITKKIMGFDPIA